MKFYGSIQNKEDLVNKGYIDNIVYSDENNNTGFGNIDTLTFNATNGFGSGSNNIIGDNAYAEGYNTKALGKYSHTEGNDTQAISENCHAEGHGTTASGDSAHAEGENTTASGQGSHAEGGSTKAEGDYSHAEGIETTASGIWGSHAEGRQTIASGQRSHAEGNMSESSGIASHAEGHITLASGRNSHAEGANTIANGFAQHVQGRYNIEDTSTGGKFDDGVYAHIVGNGSYENPSNAHTLDWDGNAWFAGDVYVGGTNQSEGNKLATETYVNTKVADIVESAPETLNTLNELAAALGDDPNFATTVATEIGKKADKTATEGHISNKGNPHEVTAEQVGAYTKEETLEQINSIANSAMGAVSQSLALHENRVDNPHNVTAQQVGAYSTSEMDVALGTKADDFAFYQHRTDIQNPHKVTAEQVGAYTKEYIDITVEELNTLASYTKEEIKSLADRAFVISGHEDASYDKNYFSTRGTLDEPVVYHIAVSGNVDFVAYLDGSPSSYISIDGTYQVPHIRTNENGPEQEKFEYSGEVKEYIEVSVQYASLDFETFLLEETVNGLMAGMHVKELAECGASIEELQAKTAALETQIGEISAALAQLHEYAQSLIGGSES